MKYLFLTFLLVGLSFVACKEDSKEAPLRQFIFESFSLGGNITNILTLQENKFFALTGKGLFENDDINNSNWRILIEISENQFFLGIKFSSKNNQKVYTGEWLNNFNDTQPLIFFTSEDDGAL